MSIANDVHAKIKADDTFPAVSSLARSYGGNLRARADLGLNAPEGFVFSDRSVLAVDGPREKPAYSVHENVVSRKPEPAPEEHLGLM